MKALPREFFMFTFTGGKYDLPPCREFMDHPLMELERIFLTECPGHYYRTIDSVSITPWMGDEELGTKLPVGPGRLWKGRGDPILYIRCYFPSSTWVDKSPLEIRSGIADYMIECKQAARGWLDKRRELLDPDKFERDFARALEKFRRAGE